MRSRRCFVLALMLLVLGLMSVVFMAACGGGATTTAPPETTATTGGTETTTAAMEWGDDIVIGSINSLTGSNVLTGEEEKWAQEKAVEDINAAGGVKLNDGKQHKLVLKFVDDKSQPTEGAAAMEKLIKTDNIKLVLGSNITPINQAAATVAEQYGAYFDIVSSWTDEAGPEGSGFAGFIGGMDLKWSTDMFESAADSGLVCVGAIKAMTPADQPQNMAVMVENTPDGVGFGDSTKAMLEGQGYKVVAYEKFVEGNKDFSSIILKFKQANVDGVVTLIAPSDGITFVKQMREGDWAPKFLFGFKGFWPVNFYRSLGSDANYICFDAFWGETLPYPYCAELGQAFRDAHDNASSVSIGLYYAGVQVLAAALERAGSTDPGAVRDEVFNGSFPGTTMGDIKYNDQGIADIPFLSYQWMEGEKRVLLYPEEFSNGDTVTFVPWGQR